MLKIINEPNIILHTRSVAIKMADIVSGKFNNLIAEMTETMIKSNGVGLAAPQVGKNIRLIIVATDPEKADNLGIKAFFNPVITFKSKEKKILSEGCLSVPGQYGLVKRIAKIRIKAIDQKGQELTFKAKGLLSQIFQHEIDHLNGELYIEKTEK